MLGRPLGGVAPASSSSSPSTTTTSRRARSSGLSCRRCQQAQPCADPRPRHRWRSPAGRIEGIELLDHGIEERVAVGLAGEAAGDEERHDVHTSRRMGDEPRRQGALTGPRPGLPPGVRLGAGAELGPFRQLAVAADERVGGDVADLRQVRRSHELTRSGRDDIRQPADGRGEPEPFHQPAEVRLRQLFVGPVDAPGGEPAGALAGVMFSHDADDPAVGPDRSPRHAFPRRRTRASGHGGRRVVQVDGQGALTAVRRHRRVPGDLLQISEHPRLACLAASPRSLKSGNPKACTASTAVQSLIRPNRAGSTSRPAVASAGIMTTARSVP